MENLNTNPPSAPRRADNLSTRGGKRRRTDLPSGLDLDDALDSIGTWPRFLLVEMDGAGEGLKKLSPFAIKKGVEGLTGKSAFAKHMFPSGNILVKVDREDHAVNLLATRQFVNIPVKVTPHRTLNTSRGVVKSRELRNTTELEMKEELKEQNVIDAQRVKIRRQGDQLPTDTYILTFGAPKPPIDVSIGYLKLPVEPYIQNPLRCYKCQRFGHHQSRCKHTAVCAKCGQGDHVSDNCAASPHCVNCKGSHPSYSRNCPVWKREREIQQVKAEQNISFAAAKKIIEARTPGSSGVSYATKVASGAQGVPNYPCPCQCGHWKITPSRPVNTAGATQASQSQASQSILLGPPDRQVKHKVLQSQPGASTKKKRQRRSKQKDTSAAQAGGSSASQVTTVPESQASMSASQPLFTFGSQATVSAKPKHTVSHISKSQTSVSASQTDPKRVVSSNSSGQKPSSQTNGGKQSAKADENTSSKPAVSPKPTRLLSRSRLQEKQSIQLQNKYDGLNMEVDDVETSQPTRSRSISPVNPPS